MFVVPTTKLYELGIRAKEYLNHPPLFGIYNGIGEALLIFNKLKLTELGHIETGMR